MNSSRYVLSSCAALAALAFTAPVSAITISAGQSVIINFDARAATPAPPYLQANVSFAVDFSSWDDGELDTGTVALFSELDGGGTRLASGVWNEGAFASGFSCNSTSSTREMCDGVFSVTYTATAGTISFDSGTFTGYTSRVQPLVGATLRGTVASPVPEPASLALLGLGALGLVGAARARRRV